MSWVLAVRITERYKIEKGLRAIKMSRVSWGLGVRCAEDVQLVVLVPGLELKKFFFSHQSFVITAYQQTK